MSKVAHRIYLSVLVIIVIITFSMLFYKGVSYYRLPVEERVFHPDHLQLKPSGVLGHGFGIFGTLFIIIGVSIYMARKRYRFLSRLGQLKYWLEFHIFLCTLGPILVLFHTANKFGGLVAVSFWSMVAVFLSGIVGRFIYIQIPHSLEGRALSLTESRKVLAMEKDDLSLDRRMERLEKMQKLFEYWHVIHMPFALVMLIIMMIHVAVTLVFGYRWIF
jgi:hypothetical protein